VRPSPPLLALAYVLLLTGSGAAQETLVAEVTALNLRYHEDLPRLDAAHAKRGRAPEARHEAEAVLAEREPCNPADWTLKDSPDARALMTSLGPAQ
jgi:hypothetical protein